MENLLHKIVFYDDRGSLELLIGAIVIDTPFHLKAPILAQAVITGIIKMPVWLRIMSRIMSGSSIHAWANASFRADEEETDVTWIKLLTHILDGTDKTDEKSSGGLNKTELWIFLEILAFNGFDPSELMLSHARKMHSYEY